MTKGFVDARIIRQALMADGWVTPDTYSNLFAPVEPISAVYLFLLTKQDTYSEALVAYVGMSGNLRQRFAGHEILEMIDRPGYWPMRWFKPTPEVDLRAVEARYISHFNPPWNIQGRTRGVVLN